MGIRNFFKSFSSDPSKDEPAPLSDAKRIHDCFTRLRKARYRLETEMLPMLEANKVHGRQGLKNNVTTWSFSMLLADRLQEKGWNVMPQQGQDAELTNLLHILDIQSEGKSGPINIKLILKQDSRKGHPRAPAIAFLRAHLDDLEQVVQGIEKAKPADIQDRHKMVYTAPRKPMDIKIIKR